MNLFTLIDERSKEKGRGWGFIGCFLFFNFQIYGRALYSYCLLVKRILTYFFINHAIDVRVKKEQKGSWQRKRGVHT